MLLCEPLEPRRLFASGDLDLTFGGGDGLTTFSTQPGSQLDRGLFVAIDSQGRIIVGGRTQANLNFGTNVEILVARFDANGALDTTFGAGTGFVKRNFINVDVPVDMLVQPDDKILLATRTQTTGVTTGWSVLRLDTSGNNDNTFDGDGVASYDFGTSENIVKMALQPDGKIVTVGAANHGTAGTKGTVVRMTSTGALDGTFGAGGVAIVEYLPGINEFYDVAFDGTKIVTTGLVTQSSSDPTKVGVARFLSNGTLDNSFDGDGKLLISGSTNLAAHSIAVDAASRVLLMNVPWPQRPSVVPNPVNIYRLTESGQPDLSFNAAGPDPGRIELADATLTHIDMGEMFVQPDQKIVFAGAFTSSTSNAFMLIRLNPDGTRDGSFGGGDGLALLTPSSPRLSTGGDMAFDSANRIVMSGLEVVAANTDFDIAAIRVQNDFITPAAVDTGTLRIRGTGGADRIELSTSGSNVTAKVNGKSYTFPAASIAWVDVESSTGSDTFDVLSGFHVINENLGDASSNLTVNIAAGASVSFKATQRLGALNVASGGSASLFAGGSKYLITDNLSVDPNGRLNLNDHDLIVNNGVFADIFNSVVAGFGNTTGITSSTSDGSQILALFDNALIGAPDWEGHPVGAGAIIGKYTYFGDANFDGQVSGDDYTVIDANLNTSPLAGIAWLSGDMNLDGAVTGDDYTVVDANLGLGSANPLSPAALLLPPRREKSESQRQNVVD